MLEAIKQMSIFEIAKLLENGADANIKDKNGTPALGSPLENKKIMRGF